jgi:hypothetical protein
VRRGHPAQAAVLVPGADQPVGRQGCGMGPSDDEAEETPRPHGGKSGIARLGQEVDDLRWVGPVVGKGSAERLGHLVDGGLWWDRSILQGRQPIQCMPVRPIERC